MIVGTAGHIDHGKTALVRALTGVDTDRLKEEKARGITIDLGFAYLPAPDGDVIGFVDVPGHERFVHNMLAGATGIDFVLLVVAADDGVMPQTREHLAIVDLLGIERGVVALTKVDLVDAERRAAVAAEIRDAARRHGARRSRNHPGLGRHRRRHRRAAASPVRGGVTALPAAPASGRFRLAVDRSLHAARRRHGRDRHGAVGLGRRSATRRGEPVGAGGARALDPCAEPAGRTRQRRASAARSISPATAISKEAIRRGDVMLDPDAARADRPDRRAACACWPRSPGRSASGFRCGCIMPRPRSGRGSCCSATSRSRPAARPRFSSCSTARSPPPPATLHVLRDTSAQRTIGGGRFLDLRAPGRRRRTPERLAQLEAHAIPAAGPAHRRAARRAAPLSSISSAFARDRALAPSEVDSLIDGLGLDLRRLSAEHRSSRCRRRAGRVRSSLVETLDGLPRRQSGSARASGWSDCGCSSIRACRAPAFAAALRGLSRAGEVALDGAWVRLPGHEVRLTPKDEALWLRVQPLLAGATASGRRGCATSPSMLARAGSGNPAAPEARSAAWARCDEVAHDHFFLRTALARDGRNHARDLAATAPDGEFTAAQFRDRLGSGRKVAIQILEFFDRHGVTVRRGDLRRVNQHRLDLFRRAGRHGAADDGSSGGASSPVGRPDFKSGRGREPVLGGFDSHSLPPAS